MRGIGCAVSANKYMKHIIIDTNVVNKDYFLRNAMIRILVESKGL